MDLDIEKDEGALFEFEFASLEDPSKNMHYHVYAFNRDTINMFAKQHGFNPDEIDINIHTECMDDNEINDNLILRAYRFRSNFSDQEYHIITCRRFVDKAIEDTAQDITNKLWFDTIIMRRDIEFIKLINQLVKELTHVFIMDNLLIDDLWNEEVSENYCKSYRIPEYGETYDIEGIIGSKDSEYVMDSLFDSSMDGEVQPITIESYVKSFTEMLTDVYCEPQYDDSNPYPF